MTVKERKELNLLIHRLETHAEYADDNVVYASDGIYVLKQDILDAIKYLELLPK